VKVSKKEAEVQPNYDRKIPFVLAIKMANSKEQQPVGDILAICHALVLKSDPQTNEWNNTGGISKVLLIKSQSVPPRHDFVYHIDGRLESTKQVRRC
jgi:hypothetical protein